MSNPYMLIGIGFAVGLGVFFLFYKWKMVAAGKTAQGLLYEAEKQGSKLKEEFLSKLIYQSLSKLT